MTRIKNNQERRITNYFIELLPIFFRLKKCSEIACSVPTKSPCAVANDNCAETIVENPNSSTKACKAMPEEKPSTKKLYCAEVRRLIFHEGKTFLYIKTICKQIR